MKKFSTVALVLAFAAASHVHAASDADPARSARCAFLPNAPDQHKVVRGDTLWDISGKFLQHPWCWPQVWGMNREEIRNPHWIYPGQIVYFDRAAGRLRLGKPVGDKGGMPTVRLSPQVRTEGLGQQAIRSIPSQIIEPFLSQPLIVEEHELQNAPRIIAAEEGRVNVGKDDRIYVRGDLQAGTAFQVFRPGSPLKDPITQKIIGYESAYLGSVKLQRAARTNDEAHVFTVVSIKQEMGANDRLLPMPPTPIINYVPHPPEQPVDASIVSIYGGVTHAGQNQIVTINRGRNQGIDVGTVLELYRYGPIITDPTQGSSYWSRSANRVKLPDQQYGNLFIFRVFNNISYGLIMQVTDTVKVGDVAKSPE
ncbi:LysM peptidoglycan-binding domain-containing protein [Noviherbaspirillum cavernae]|uniref:LysM peptidoglycan-binding domain-containing protein n=1 Tax=Noviherbaspirillum cavernae TaxID=2320862 RepID=A0A418X5M3_9BURK|nr:LysM peptidoglycan-binding domain-containing protein [Noviherbaspirillum cavernae]RJG07745.1 LysM peptidoglycan-binding domain-containing protein [Noviherbaspirillum cavernae]